MVVSMLYLPTCMRHLTLSAGVRMVVAKIPESMPALKCWANLFKKHRHTQYNLHQVGINNCMCRT